MQLRAWSAIQIMGHSKGPLQSLNYNVCFAMLQRWAAYPAFVVSLPLDCTTSYSTASSSASVSPAAYLQQHAAIVGDVAAVLERLGLKPDKGCQIGDGVATVDMGFVVGDPPQQVCPAATTLLKATMDLKAASSIHRLLEQSSLTGKLEGGLSNQVDHAYCLACQIGI
jgi:hypothetical protein